MTDREMVCVANYKRLARAVIETAIDDLYEHNVSASKFFGSDWFAYLCKVAQFDHRVIRTEAYAMPGFVNLDSRRASSALPTSKAIAMGRKRQKHGKPLAPLIAFPPDGGDPFAINGYTNAAKMLGCTPAAVKLATDQNRSCLGWVFKKRMEVFK